MESHAALADWWRRTSGLPASCVDAHSTIVDLERRYGVKLPQDFKQYLLTLAPAEDLWEDTDATWWSLDRIKNIPDEYKHPIHEPEIAAEANTYLFFADFLLWSSAWAICCSDGKNRGKIAIITGATDRFLADSFSQFIERYLHDSTSVW